MAVVVAAASSFAATATHDVPCEDGVSIAGDDATCDADLVRDRTCSFVLHVPRGGARFDVPRRVRVGHRKTYSVHELFHTNRYLMRCEAPPRRSFERVALLENVAAGSAASLAVTRRHIAVGAPGVDCHWGTVLIYDRRTLALSAEVHRSSTRTEDLFGTAVAADGDDFLVGSPRVGEVVRVDPDGRLLATIVRPGRPPLGTPPGDATDFGAAIAAGDGQLAVAWQEKADVDTGNALQVFDARSGVLRWQTRLPPPRFPPAVTSFGRRVAVSAGHCRSVASPSSCVVLFDIRNGYILTEITPPPGTPREELFGVSLSLGETLLVGSPAEGGGSAYEFDPRSGRLLRRYRRGPAALESDLSFFGRRVFTAGAWIAVADPSAHFDTGSVYLYERRRGRFLQRFDNRYDDGEYGAGFARSGDALLIAEQDTSNQGYVEILRPH